MPYAPDVRIDRVLATAVFGGALFGCNPGLPLPELDEVDPNWGYNGEDTDVVLIGEDFFPQVRVSGQDDFEVDRQYHAWFVGTDGDAHELDGVAMRSYTELDATVPTGLDPGLYDLRLVGPTDELVSMTNAFEVRDTRADRISATTDDYTHVVGDLVVVDLALLDPDGQAVAQPFSVDVSVADADTAALLSFEETLSFQEPLEDDLGIRGNLGSNGEGYVVFTSTGVADLRLVISPSDPESGIQGESIPLVFVAGETEQVQVDVLGETDEIAAGDPVRVRLTLLDGNGNLTSRQLAKVRLTEGCGGTLDQEVEIVDSGTTEVVLTAATGEVAGCDENIVHASTELASGSSDPFQVLPGEPAEYDVYALPERIVAGEDTLDVIVQVNDTYGNRVINHISEINLDDSAAGPLTPDQYSCSAFNGGTALCQAHPTVADPLVVVTARGDTISGESNTIEVVAGAAVELRTEVDLTGGTIAAGVPFVQTVRVLDSYENAVELDPLGDDQPNFEDGSGSLSCQWDSRVAPLNTESYRCTATLAESFKVVEVSLDTHQVSGETVVFEVVNGELDGIGIDLAGVTEIQAGESLSVALTATDAYGNPYLVQSDATVALADLTGTVSPASVELDSSGRATADLSFTLAWDDDEVAVSHSSGGSGVSSSFDVVAGELDHFVIDLASTWFLVDESQDITLTATDVYGNAIEDYQGSVNLVSTDELAEEVEVDSFDAGLATVELTFTDVGLADTLEADDGQVSGVSDTYDVVESGCTQAPEAALSANTQDPLTVCRGTGGSTSAVTLSAASSTSSGSALATFHFDDGNGDWTRTSADELDASWNEVGAFVARVLVVDQNACSDEATATIFVADDDGSVAGPVDVTIADTELVAGSSAHGDTTVSLSASDCRGDPAQLQTLHLRADLGVLGSASSTVSASGSGLTVLTDSSGEAEVALSMASETGDGDAEVHAGAAGGAAYGSDEATVTGGSRLPIVTWVDPYGQTDEVVDAVEVTFSEAMRSASFTTSVLTLEGDDGAAVQILAGTLAQSVLTLSLDEDLDLSTQGYTLIIESGSSGAHDPSGNCLDGLYDESCGDFELRFGDVDDDAIDMQSCNADLARFRPDGDDGADEEADSVEISLVADDIPAWWEVFVSDSDGEAVFVDRQTGTTSASDTWTWDGRGNDGVTVQNGTYTLEIAAIDASWNARGACEVNVELDNHVRPPPGDG